MDVIASFYCILTRKICANSIKKPEKMCFYNHIIQLKYFFFEDKCPILGEWIVLRF